MIARRSTLRKKKMKCKWITNKNCSLTSAASKSLSPKPSNPNSCSARAKCNRRMMMRMRMQIQMRTPTQMKSSPPVLTTLSLMLTYQSLVKSRNSLNILTDSNLRKLILTPKSSHLFQTLSQQLARLIHSWRCQSLMEPRKILVSQCLTNQLWIMRTRLS